MSKNAKKKKRVGFGVFRIKRGGLGKRMIVQIFSEQPVITHTYFTDLNDELYNNVMSIQNQANESMEFSLPNISYDWEIHTENEADSLLNCEGTIDNDPDIIRVIISEKGICIETEKIERLMNLVCLTATKDNITPIFDNTQLNRENIKATMHVSDVIDYTRCFFLDVVMANSKPISCVVKKYIEHNGIDDFFKRKVHYAIKNKLYSYHFPIPDKDADYVSFASLCLEKYEVNFGKLIELWDRFILTELTNYLPSCEEICDIINSKDGHINQLNTSRLLSNIIDKPNGIYVVMLPYDNPQKKKHFLEAKSKYNFKSGSPEHWHKQIGVISWDKFLKMKNPLVENTKIEPFKIYIYNN